MPIDLVTPAEAKPAVTFDRCIIAGFEVQESDYNTGLPAQPVLIIYWLKLDRATGAVSDRGAHRMSPAIFVSERPDGAISYRANLKARLYLLLQDAGVFPAGTVV